MKNNLKYAVAGAALLAFAAVSDDAHALVVGDYWRGNTYLGTPYTLVVTSVSAASVTGTINGVSVTANRKAGVTDFTALSVTGRITGTDTVEIIVAGTTLYTGKFNALKAKEESLIVAYILGGDIGATIETSATIEQEAVTAQQNKVSVRNTSRSIGNRLSSLRSVITSPSGVTPGTKDVSYGGGAGVVTGLASGGSSLSGFGIWMQPIYTRFKDKNDKNRFNGNTKGVLLGADAIIGKKSVVGVALGTEDTDRTLKTTTGSLDSRGYSLSLYGAHNVTDVFMIDGFLGYGLNNQDRDDIFGKANFDSKRLYAGVNGSAIYKFDKIETVGKLGYVYSREKTDNYTTDKSTNITPGASTMSQINANVEVGYNMGMFFTPFVAITAEHEMKMTGEDDKNGAVATLGARIAGEVNLSGQISMHETLFRKDQRERTFTASLRYAF